MNKLDIVFEYVKEVISFIFQNRPSCETCSFDVDIPGDINPPSNCYDARHTYPSQCPKDIWSKDWVGI